VVEIKFEPPEEEKPVERWHRELPPVPEERPREVSGWVRWAGVAVLPVIVGIVVGGVLFFLVAQSVGRHYTIEKANFMARIGVVLFWVGGGLAWAWAVRAWWRFTMPEDEEENGE
jgi:hypothetical protein